MTSSPVTEFVTFPATAVLKANPELFREAVQVIGGKNVPAGMMDQAWGFELKEPEIWRGFLS